MNELRVILKKATAEELQGLAGLLDPDFDLSISSLVEPGADLSRFLETDRGREVYIDLIAASFKDNSESVFSTFFPARSYRAIDMQVADKHGCRIPAMKKAPKSKRALPARCLRPCGKR